MTESVFRTAAVVGTGMMGPGIAATLALGGVETAILSRAAETAMRGLEMALDITRSLEREGLTTPERGDWAREHLSSTADLNGVVARVDLVIESAPENMEFKQTLFAHMDAISRSTCVLASNTSGLSITDIQSKCSRPERVATTHFWNPPSLMPLVEIVKGKDTSDETAEKLRVLLKHCGKIPVIVKKDTPGQLGNRLQSALIREALYIVQEGIADVEDVDLAVKCGFGLRTPVYGVFEHMDIVGFEVAAAVADYVSRDLCNHAGVMPIMREKIARGQTFCDWSTKTQDDVKERRNAFLLDFMKRYRVGA